MMNKHVPYKTKVYSSTSVQVCPRITKQELAMAEFIEYHVKDPNKRQQLRLQWYLRRVERNREQLTDYYSRCSERNPKVAKRLQSEPMTNHSPKKPIDLEYWARFVQ